MGVGRDRWLDGSILDFGQGEGGGELIKDDAPNLSLAEIQGEL